MGRMDGLTKSQGGEFLLTSDCPLPPPVSHHSDRAAMLESSSQVANLQQQVQRQAAYQSLIRQLTFAIRGSVELPSISQIALEGATEVLHASRAMILRLKFWDPRHLMRSPDRIPKARVIIEGSYLNPTKHPLDRPDSDSSGGDPIPPNPPLSHSFWVSDCHLFQYAMGRGSQTLVFNDARDFEICRSVLPPSPEQPSAESNPLDTPEPSLVIAPLLQPEEMPALLFVPLESKNKLLGFLAIQNAQPRTWQADEIELAELVAAQLSAAIIQTETLRQVESLVEERTAQLQQSLELQAKLYEITRKQIEKLREMNQRMDEFLSTLSHELRTPLTSMMLAIRMLREANLSPERRLQYLNILEQQCAQETSLINDLLALQELESKQVAMQMQAVDLKRTIEEVSHSFDQRWALKGLVLEVNMPTEEPSLFTDAASLNRILLELLTNAGKYSDPNTAIQLQVSTTPDRKLLLTLSNIGQGISPEELPHIFDKFRRCQGMTQNAVPGTGLGLALVKSLVQHLNGSIIATSNPIPDSQSYETSFVVTLPQAPDLPKP
ncbi:ATP-binding protein [Alkalinema pantanalense CENA528]|uniref:GAF domain-containing sensor histidine kinase n=1 Tax=Alkalinema pantanalense TaxID=1620705 RepID=UPI003D6DE5CB